MSNVVSIDELFYITLDAFEEKTYMALDAFFEEVFDSKMHPIDRGGCTLNGQKIKYQIDYFSPNFYKKRKDLLRIAADNEGEFEDEEKSEFDFIDLSPLASKFIGFNGETYWLLDFKSILKCSFFDEYYKNFFKGIREINDFFIFPKKTRNKPKYFRKVYE